jgi:hypothetical protein
MVKISRYILVVIAIVGFSIGIPKLYWMAFSKPIRVPFVMYSCIENDFMIQRSGEDGLMRQDTRGNNYTREEYEEKLPFLYVRQLLMSNTMPDSINGVEMDTHEISMNRSTFRVQPEDLDSPTQKLFPLFEAESGRANLEMPEDYFRISWRMEFVDAKSNKILEEKSRMFSAVLYNRGFEFPAKSINGIPTTRKSCDEGYLVVDSKDQLFHIKMIEGEPFVEKVKLPGGMKFKYVSCVDFRNKNFYAYLFSTNNELYILTQDEYELIKFPVENIDPAKNQIRIYSDLFHYNIIVSGDDFVKVYALDTNYKNVNDYYETWPAREDRSEGKIIQALFPGQISMTDSDSNFIRFYTTFNSSLYWLVLSVLLIGVQFVIIKKRNLELKKNIIDFIIIGVSGIFGFLAVNIFPNKFFD